MQSRTTNLPRLLTPPNQSRSSDICNRYSVRSCPRCSRTPNPATTRDHALTTPSGKLSCTYPPTRGPARIIRVHTHRLAGRSPLIPARPSRTRRLRRRRPPHRKKAEITTRSARVHPRVDRQYRATAQALPGKGHLLPCPGLQGAARPLHTGSIHSSRKQHSHLPSILQALAADGKRSALSVRTRSSHPRAHHTSRDADARVPTKSAREPPISVDRSESDLQRWAVLERFSETPATFRHFVRRRSGEHSPSTRQSVGLAICAHSPRISPHGNRDVRPHRRDDDPSHEPGKETYISPQDHKRSKAGETIAASQPSWQHKPRQQASRTSG